MKLVPTEHIPGRCAKHDLQKLIEEFINGEAKVVNVDFNEHDYSSSKSCAGCFHNAIRRSGYSVKVCRRGDKVFLYGELHFSLGLYPRHKAKKAHHRWNFGERVIAFWRIGPYGDDHKKQR